ncbi:hypothetical protein GCM10011409_20050 [Lentibacillus populi]|uniref:Uncharacterized protein n=1 Tax=Lentibacillus populi TaxID=1827502 RepID=A0A9W5TXH3_9BACI|nr:hypothetical protein [Lentibacillus populi]GGB42466.1 hypothetical protein GCM10011409_20050 [Lentibacillus populi]
MDVVEIEKNNYLFAMDKKPNDNKVYVLKKDTEEIRFLYMVKLVGNSKLDEQHKHVADTFFNRVDKLDHEGHSRDEIFKEMQLKRKQENE